jgi:hypothetical protein
MVQEAHYPELFLDLAYADGLAGERGREFDLAFSDADPDVGVRLSAAGQALLRRHARRYHFGGLHRDWGLPNRHGRALHKPCCGSAGAHSMGFTDRDKAKATEFIAPPGYAQHRPRRGCPTS